MEMDFTLPPNQYTNTIVEQCGKDARASGSSYYNKQKGQSEIKTSIFRLIVWTEPLPACVSSSVGNIFFIFFCDDCISNGGWIRQSSHKWGLFLVGRLALAQIKSGSWNNVRVGADTIIHIHSPLRFHPQTHCRPLFFSSSSPTLLH